MTAPAPAWMALSDAPGPAAVGSGDAPMQRGSLVLEFAVPLERAAVLLDHRMGEGAGEWVLSILADPAAGVAIRHRIGRAMVRHTLPVPLPHPTGGILRLVWHWGAAPGRRWSLRLDDLTGAAPAVRRGDDALPLPVEAVWALCRGGAASLRDPALRWFGITPDDDAPQDPPWIGTQTPIETPGGPVAAAALRVGDAVATPDGTAMVASVERRTVPARGSRCPVLLRAPYFGAGRDLLVSPDQPVAMAGPVVEYLFGEETVLVEARCLVDGRAALHHDSRAVAEVICLTLDRGAALLADGCTLAVAGPGAPPGRLLCGYEVPPLLAQLGRGPQVRAA